jgi:hypothetical protein
MPSGARARPDAIVGNRKNFHIVPIDMLDMRQVRQGCFDYVWDCCQDYLLAGRRMAGIAAPRYSESRRRDH